MPPYIDGSRRARREIYHQFFRKWHWRLGLEMLLYSFLDPDFGQVYPRYSSMTANVLLGAGADDDYNFTNIFTQTRVIAGLMKNANGNTLFLLDTGHSIHNERPNELASAILGFLAGTPPSGTVRGGFCQWTSDATVSCLRYETHTTAVCNKYEDDGYNSCAQWSAQCCTWWPCSWACDIVSWLCNAWYWVSNVVCKVWCNIVQQTCQLWGHATRFVCQ